MTASSDLALISSLQAVLGPIVLQSSGLRDDLYNLFLNNRTSNRYWKLGSYSGVYLFPSLQPAYLAVLEHPSSLATPPAKRPPVPFPLSSPAGPAASITLVPPVVGRVLGLQNQNRSNESRDPPPRDGPRSIRSIRSFVDGWRSDRAVIVAHCCGGDPPCCSKKTICR